MAEWQGPAVKGQKSKLRSQKSRVHGRSSKVEGQRPEVEDGSSKAKGLRSWLTGLLVVSLVALMTLPVYAQSQLDSLIAIAVRDNPEIQMARYQSMAARAGIDPAGQLPDPQLKVGAMNFPTDFNFSSQSMTMAPAFTLMEMFPWFGKLSAAEDVRKYGYESTADRLASVTLAVVTNLKEVYGKTYSIEKSIEYLQYKKLLLQGVVKVAEQLFAVGQVPQQDVFRATAELTMVQSGIITMQGSLSDLEARLGAILGRNGPCRIQVDTLDLPPLTSLTILETRLKEQNPDLKQVKNMERAAQAKALFARKAAIPDLSAGISYGFRGALMPNGMKVPNLMSVQVGMSLPIFFGAKQQKVIDEADFMERAASEQYGTVSLGLFSKLRSTYADAEAGLKLIPLYSKELIPQYEATYNSSLSSYSVGKTSFAMLISNLTTLINTRIEYVKIQSQYFTAAAEIAKLVGHGAQISGGG